MTTLNKYLIAKNLVEVQNNGISQYDNYYFDSLYKNIKPISKNRFEKIKSKYWGKILLGISKKELARIL